jgi:hypothetical protein
MFSLNYLGGGLGETWINHDLFGVLCNNDFLLLILAFNADENDNTAAAADKKDANDCSCDISWAEFYCVRSSLANLSVILPSGDLK